MRTAGFLRYDMGGRHLIGASILCILGAATPILANDKLVRLAVPAQLVETGLLKHILPRFSLKTQVRVELVAPGDDADVALGDTGERVFTGPVQTWSLEVLAPDHKGTARFADWLTDTTGQSAVTSFTVDGAHPFQLPVEEVVVEVAPDYDGDTDRGKLVAKVHCGRCHVATEEQKGMGIGSTPSFFALKTFADWDARFQNFFILAPHSAFTQIDGVTDPFPVDRPSPIAPIELTIEDIDAIMAYVSAIEPASLGKPVQSQ